jgi:hypothetical protein
VACPPRLRRFLALAVLAFEGVLELGAGIEPFGSGTTSFQKACVMIAAVRSRSRSRSAATSLCSCSVQPGESGYAREVMSQ